MWAFYIGDILMFLGGTALTWSSSEIPKLSNKATTPFDHPISSDEATWVSSLITLGATFGSFLFGYLADKMGRKYTLLSAGVPFLICYLMQAFGTFVELFYCARFVMGLTVGGVFILLPIYAGELSDKDNRGQLGSLMSCAVCSGLLFSYALGPFVNVMVFNLILAAFSAIFLILFTFLGEEVPHYYVSINEEDMAKEVLQKLRGDYINIDGELYEIQMKYKESNGTFCDIFRSKSLKRAFLTSVGLLVFQQFSGINVVLFYSQEIFKDIGADLPPEICTIIIGAVQFLSSFITPLIGDKFGRKNILTFSALGMVLSSACLGTYAYFQAHNVDLTSVSYLPIVFLTVFIITYNTGYGPLPWVMLGELFPTKVKSIATSVACFVNWALAFFITKYFAAMLSVFELAGYFWFSAGCCVVAAIFAKCYVIETRGKTLEEIQDALDS